MVNFSYMQSKSGNNLQNDPQELLMLLTHRPLTLGADGVANTHYLHVAF